MPRILLAARLRWAERHPEAPWTIDDVVRYALFDAPHDLRQEIVRNPRRREYLVSAVLDGRLIGLHVRKEADGSWSVVLRVYVVPPRYPIQGAFP